MGYIQFESKARESLMDIPHMPFLFAVAESMREIIFTYCPILGGTVVRTVEVSISDGSRPTYRIKRIGACCTP